jgi:hypothetical protein
MRSLGKDDLAQQAELFAARVRFDLDDPVAAQRLYGLARDLRELSSRGSLLHKALEGALTLSPAERGNIQILDPETGLLTIVAQYEFGVEFLDYWTAPAKPKSAAGVSPRPAIVRGAGQRARLTAACGVAGTGETGSTGGIS